MKLNDRFNPKNKLEQLFHSVKKHVPSLWDILITVALLSAATAIGSFFHSQGFTDSNIVIVYLICVLLTSLFTRSYVCSILSSVFSVILFTFFHTEPLFSLTGHDSSDTITFVIMLAASIMIATLASSMKQYAQVSNQTAFAAKVLLDTNRLLHQAQDFPDIVDVTSSQLKKLLNRDIVVYYQVKGRLSEGIPFCVDPTCDSTSLVNSSESAGANYVYRTQKRAGATTNILPDLSCLYLPVSLNDVTYGVIGIHIDGKPLDTFEDRIVLSIIGEGALAVENLRNVSEKEKASAKAENEQRRASFLRAVSHDLRTPLTSISGNAANLLSEYDHLDDMERKQIFVDIYEESMWLINLVENLLSSTRIEEGRLYFNMSLELMDEVIEEALRHVNQNKNTHPITVLPSQELLFARMDAKLIIQVIINLVNNAIIHTPPGTKILITTKRDGDMISVSIADTGPGIPDELKPRVFDMFFTGRHKVADYHRSLGLGLYLCHSIIDAHKGTITLTDNKPHGAIFTFCLPSGEVTIHE